MTQNQNIRLICDPVHLKVPSFSATNVVRTLADRPLFKPCRPDFTKFKLPLIIQGQKNSRLACTLVYGVTNFATNGRFTRRICSQTKATAVWLFVRCFVLFMNSQLNEKTLPLVKYA